MSVAPPRRRGIVAAHENRGQGDRTSAGRLGSTTYLVSPIAIGMAWLLLGEVPVPLALVGGALAIAGVIVARSCDRPAISLRRRTT